MKDPYRWLEKTDAQEVRAWVAAQSKLTKAYLHRGSERQRILHRLEELRNYERVGVPRRAGRLLFFRRNAGLDEQAALLVAENLARPARVLIDPAELAEAEVPVLLRGVYPGPQGKAVAYALSRGGSDWTELRVRDVKSGKDLAADRLTGIKFSGASWAPDGSGFAYSRYPDPDSGTGPRIYFHRKGTPQAEDILLYERPDHPEQFFDASYTEDGRYLVIEVWKQAGGGNALLVRDLESKQRAEPVPLVPGFDASSRVLGNEGPLFWVSTRRGAPRGRIVSIHLGDPRPGEFTDLVPEGRDTLRFATLVGNHFVAEYLHLAQSRVLLYRLDGTRERELKLPGPGSVSGFTGRRNDEATYFAFTSFTTPREIYRYDFEKGIATRVAQPRTAFHAERFATRQVAYRGAEGKDLTMFLVQEKGIRLDGNRPVLLTGYGGFGIAMTPRFDPAWAVWLELGGVLALPNLPGGGAYGEAWHKAGRRAHKQRVFDDFIAAAEALVSNGYTKPARLGIAGHSNGGLLVAACMVQRPELFAACLPAAGVLDMLRYQKFGAGRFWTQEYGSSADPKMFRILLAYSPYHNIRPGVRYPATLITTADHDDRVVPAHSYKFAARLQAAQAGPAPILLRVESGAGHGGPLTSQWLEIQADRFGFLARALSVRVPRRIRG